MQRCRTLVLSLVPLLVLGAGEIRAQGPKVPDTLEQR